MEKIDFFPSHKPINFTFTREGEMEWFKRSREPQGEGTHYGMLKENFKRETVVGTRYQKWSYILLPIFLIISKKILAENFAVIILDCEFLKSQIRVQFSILMSNLLRNLMRNIKNVENLNH